MRILMLNNEFPPLGGGMGTVNQALLQRFAGVANLEIDLITSAIGKESEEIRFAENIRIFKVPVNNRLIHHSTVGELIRYALQALPLARTLAEARPYDLCFAWSAVPAGWVAWRLRRKMKLRYIVRVTGPDIPGFERRYRLLYPFLKPMIRVIWRGAAFVIAKCNQEASMIAAMEPRARIELIPNGVDASKFQPRGSIPDGGPFHLICVARLIERKGQRHLLAALRKLKGEGWDVKLDLVGEGDAEAEYRREAERLGISDRVRFRGYIPREEMPNQYAAAHAFVLPSYNEGMSMALLEAMACGLPVVVTDTGGTDELVIDDQNGFKFPRGDVESLTVHLRRLVNDRELARRMGEASRLRAMAYSWESVISKYMELFSRLAPVSKPGA